MRFMKIVITLNKLGRMARKNKKLDVRGIPPCLLKSKDMIRQSLVDGSNTNDTIPERFVPSEFGSFYHFNWGHCLFFQDLNTLTKRHLVSSMSLAYVCFNLKGATFFQNSFSSDRKTEIDSMRFIMSRCQKTYQADEGRSWKLFQCAKVFCLLVWFHYWLRNESTKQEWFEKL